MIIKAGIELAIVFSNFPLPTEFVQVHVEVDSTQVEELEEVVIPN